MEEGGERRVGGEREIAKGGELWFRRQRVAGSLHTNRHFVVEWISAFCIERTDRCIGIEELMRVRR